MDDCIFCKIVKKEAPAEVVFENQQVLAFKNIAPVSEVHILIIPKKHITSFMEIKEMDVMKELTKAAQEVVKDRKIESAYKLVINGGKYQAVKHLHWHLLGGKLEDERDVLNKT